MPTRAALHDASACWHVCKSYVVYAGCQRTTLFHSQKRSRSTLYLSPRESESWGLAPRIVKAEEKGASEKGLIRHRNIWQVDLI